MITYILRRCVQAVPVLIGITLFTFLMVHLTPGDPVQASSPGTSRSRPSGPSRSAISTGSTNRSGSSTVDYMDDLLHGDLGAGLHNKRPVWDTISEAIWPDLPTHAGRAGWWRSTLGVTLGILAAIFHNTWIDSGAMVIALLGVSLPVFYLGLLMLFVFSFQLHLFPATGVGGWRIWSCRR